jgi:hypothetical protein
MPVHGTCPCLPSLQRSSDAYEWSSRSRRSIPHARTGSHSPWELELELEDLSVGGEAEGESTTTCRRECDSAKLRYRCVEVGYITHPRVPTLSSVSCLLYYREARSSASHRSSLSRLASFSCISPQLRVLCCPAASASTPVWQSPADLGVVAGSARNRAAPSLCSTTVVHFGVDARNSVLAKCGANSVDVALVPCALRPRSLPVLEPQMA